MSTFFVSGVFNVPTEQINQNVNQNDIYVVCDTSTAPCTIYLPQITPQLSGIKIYISDRSNNAFTNNIFIVAQAGESINAVAFTPIHTNGGSCICYISSTSTTDNESNQVEAKWIGLQSDYESGGVLGFVESVVAGTDISVDNTDPANPIVNYVGTTPDLQAVTGVGNITTNQIIAYSLSVSDASKMDYISVGAYNNTNVTGAFLLPNGTIQLTNSVATSTFKNTNVTIGNAVNLQVPNKASGDYTIATIDDLNASYEQTFLLMGA